MSERQLSFGIQTAQQHVEFSELLRVWQEAESLGYDSAWIFDYVIPIFPNQKPIFPIQIGPFLECWTTLAALAAKTSTLRVGVLGSSWQHPMALANVAMTVDVISEGRLEFGVRAGWFEMEYRAYGQPLPKLTAGSDRLPPVLQTIKRLWSMPSAMPLGKYYRLNEAPREFRPVQRPHAPIWIGGAGRESTLRLVAENADGWITFMIPIQEYQQKLGVLAAHCQRINRNPAAIKKALVFGVTLAENREKADQMIAALRSRGAMSTEDVHRRLTIVTPEECAAMLRPYADAGVDLFIMGLRTPYDYTTLRLFAEKVIPLLR